MKKNKVHINNVIKKKSFKKIIKTIFQWLSAPKSELILRAISNQ